MKQYMQRVPAIAHLSLFLLPFGLLSCAHSCPCPIQPTKTQSSWSAIFSRPCHCPQPPPAQRIVVSVEQQVMVTFENNTPKKRYPVSTSRFGLGDKLRSNQTPLGRLEVIDIIGEGLPKGSLLRGRAPTGQILRANTPGCDAIVTRILRLRGKEPQNAHAFKRCIYIHGTTNEKCLKTAASWGCVRMGSKDIIRLCHWVIPGARVDILPGKLPPPELLPQ